MPDTHEGLPVETDNAPRPEDGPQDDLPQEPGSEVGGDAR